MFSENLSRENVEILDQDLTIKVNVKIINDIVAKVIIELKWPWARSNDRIKFRFITHLQHDMSQNRIYQTTCVFIKPSGYRDVPWSAKNGFATDHKSWWLQIAGFRFTIEAGFRTIYIIPLSNVLSITYKFLFENSENSPDSKK